LPRATWRHSRDAQPIRAFDLSLCVPEFGAFRSGDDQSPRGSGSLETRKDALVRKGSRRFSLRSAKHDDHPLD
jgi:hypothetical protein